MKKVIAGYLKSLKLVKFELTANGCVGNYKIIEEPYYDFINDNEKEIPGV